MFRCVLGATVSNDLPKTLLNIKEAAAYLGVSVKIMRHYRAPSRGHARRCLLAGWSTDCPT